MQPIQNTSEDDTFNALHRTPFHVVFNYLYSAKGKEKRTNEQDAAYLKPHGWTTREYDAEVQRVFYPPQLEDNW